ncbi:MAG: ATP-binding cassette domain-containing protein [Bernardetiaceae bacterium]
MSLHIEHLVKTYGEQRAVDDISFSAEAGEILGFLGPNGAGKSTTLKIATTVLMPTDGQVRLCGYDVREQPARVRRSVGYLPEHNPLYPEMYIKEYLTFVAGLYGIRGQQARMRITELIERCGLEREQHKQIGMLSKGYRQRVGLAQALIHDPEVLILDEPTTGLDPNQILEIREVIREIGQQKTVVFSTHILPEVQALCQRVVIIHQGRLVANSRVEELGRGDARFAVRVAFLREPTEWDVLSEAFEISLLPEGGYLIQASEDPRQAIFRYAVATDNPILEMRLQEQSLEHIFRGLTQGQPNT